MDTNLMIRYVDYLNDMSNDDECEVPAMIVYDLFKEHLKDSVKDKFHDSDIDLVVILAGLTSICQPLDITINKPFKDNLHKKWHLWMTKGGARKTAAGNLRHARINLSSKSVEIVDLSSKEIVDLSSKDFEIVDLSSKDVEI
ncbi:31950_t:CDS:2, partial [Racocetra persica]